MIFLKKLKTFLFNSTILIITSLILKVIGLYFNSYVSTKISTEAFGIFQLIMSIYAFGITLASAGINLATTRIISEEIALNNTVCVKKIIIKAIILSLSCGILASVIILLNSDFILITCFHNKVNKTIIYMICIALPFISMSSAITGYFNAVRKVYKTASSQFIEQFIKISSIAFLFSLFMPLTIENACFALILGDLVSEIGAFLYLFILYCFDKNIYKVNVKCTSNDSYTKKLLGVSVPVALTSYLRSGLSTVKQLIIPSSLEKSGIDCSIALSKYGIISGMSMQIIMFPILFISSFSTLLIPEFSRYYAKRDYKRIKEVSIFVLILTSLFSVLSTVLIYAFANKLSLVIFQNTECGYYLKLLAPVIIFIYIDNVVDSILKGINVQVRVMVINIIDLLFTVAIIYFLVPIMSIKGYIISIYISEIFNFSLSLGLLILELRKHNNISISKRNMSYSRRLPKGNTL